MNTREEKDRLRKQMLQRLKDQPDAGGLFHINLDVAGVPSTAYRG